jgi:hypothetical protein
VTNWEDEESTRMNSDFRDTRRLVEDEGVPKSQVQEERRRDELVDRQVGAYGLNANYRLLSLGSKSEGFGRITLWDYMGCDLSNDLLTMYFGKESGR